MTARVGALTILIGVLSFRRRSTFGWNECLMNVDSCESDCPGAIHEFTNPANVIFPALRKQCGSWAEDCGRIQRKDSLFPGQVRRVFENRHMFASM